MNGKRIVVLSLVLAALLPCAAVSAAELEETRASTSNIPSITVVGTGQSGSAPDLAVVQLGAVAEADSAGDAQKQVNAILQGILKKVKAAGVPEKEIQTSSLTLSPIYPIDRPVDHRQSPRITGYRAANVVQIRVRDMKRLGEVVDAGVSAGANEIQGISFELENDLAARRLALQRAVQEARAKAETIAAAMDVRIEGISEVVEGAANIVQPKMEMFRAAAAMADMSTPVQPGQVRVDATVTVRYRIAPSKNSR